MRRHFCEKQSYGFDKSTADNDKKRVATARTY